MNIGDNTPWGAAQNVDTISKGIEHVTTASHGGIYLSPDRNALVPDYMKRGTWQGQGHEGWYEEDCDWCIPVIIFEDEFRAHAGPWRPFNDTLLAARDTFQNCHKNAYAIHQTLLTEAK